MHTLSNEMIAQALDQMPDPSVAVAELFDRAKTKSEENFQLSIFDIEIYHDESEAKGKPMPLLGNSRDWVVMQVGRLLTSLTDIPEEAEEEERVTYLLMQLSCYSQLWECIGFQRLIYSLVRTANSKDYDPNLLIDHDPGTFKILESIMTEATEASLSFVDLLAAVYHSLIRNSFAHSDFMITGKAISTAPDLVKGKKTFYISSETWNRLYKAVVQLANTIYKMKYDARSELAKQSGFTYTINGFDGPITIFRHANGRWLFQH